jgi:hypothetical protein
MDNIDINELDRTIANIEDFIENSHYHNYKEIAEETEKLKEYLGFTHKTTMKSKSKSPSLDFLYGKKGSFGNSTAYSLLLMENKPEEKKLLPNKEINISEKDVLGFKPKFIDRALRDTYSYGNPNEIHSNFDYGLYINGGMFFSGREKLDKKQLLNRSIEILENNNKIKA